MRARLRSFLIIGALVLLALPAFAAQRSSSVAVTSSSSSFSNGRIWYPTGHYPELSLPGRHHEAVRSLLNITKPMQFGDFVWDEDHIAPGPVWVRVDLSHQILSVFRGGDEIGSAVILYGSDGTATPVGNFTILGKSAHYWSHSYDAPMPYMLRLTKDGVAIHGSDVHEGWATHGCIGVPLDFARLLFSVASKGDLVFIIPGQSKS